MATVQELLALAQAKSQASNPLAGALTGFAQGAGEAQQNAIPRAVQLLDLAAKSQAMQIAQQRQKQLSDLITSQAEQTTQSNLNGAAAQGTPPTPASRFGKMVLDKIDSNGPEFKVVQPKDFESKVYVDDQGVSRLGSYDPVAGKMVTSPNDPKAPQDLQMAMHNNQFVQKQYDSILEKNNPYTGSSRTTVGIIGRTSLAANRALTTLSRPDVTNQEAGNVMADIASIYQGGNPTDAGMSHQNYQTLYGKAQGLVQMITGKPQDAVPDAIKQRLISTLNDMKGQNGQLMQQALALQEAGQSRVLNHPLIAPQWDAFKKEMLSIGGGGAPTAGAAGGTVTFRASDGTMHIGPAAGLDAARKIDPGLQVVSQ